MGLTKFIQYIKEGEPVSPGTPNRPISQLDQNIKYILNLLDEANVGSSVYARSQTVVSTIQVGQPVFFNAASARFEAAFATAESDSATGYLTVPNQSQVWGIVASKQNATLADILLFGYAKIDITAAVGNDLTPGGNVPAGLWYLSGSSAGQLIRQSPPLSIPVCKTDNSGNVFVNTAFVDFLENHRHYVFDLQAVPAGQVTPPAVGDAHVIVSADSSLPGWLPADDPVFDGNAPAGAKFGYNISVDESLYSVYPPIPLQSACVVMQRPSIYDVLGERKWYGQQLMSDLVVIDRNGIWWMSDCYDEVPWPTDLDTSSSASAAPVECDPASKLLSLKLYFTRVGFATDNSSVTSLRSLDARLKVFCAGTDDPAFSGDIELDLDLSLMNGVLNKTGYTVIKEFDVATNTFNSGPVVEGVYSNSTNVLLSGDESATVGGITYYKGKIGIGVLSQPTQELSSQLVRLEGVTEESYPVLYLGMPNDNTTSYVVKFEVPGDAPANSDFQFRPRILAKAAGTLPQLTVTYFKTARPVDGLNVPVNVTQAYTALTMNTVATLLANQAVEAISAAIAVDPGDIVYIKVTRTPSSPSDNYAGELGIMQQVGVLTSQG
jgi:hypothetical protein